MECKNQLPRTEGCEKITQRESRVWIFQCNPKRWDMMSCFANPDHNEGTWEVNQYKNEIKNGDLALIWKSGNNSGIYAVAEIRSDPEIMGDIPNGRYWLNESDKGKKRLRVLTKSQKKFVGNPILRDELKILPGLEKLSILNFWQGTNFPVKGSEWEILKEMIDKR